MTQSFLKIFIFAILTIVFWEVVADLLEILIKPYTGKTKIYILIILATITSIMLYSLGAEDFTG
jgi:hypothetical protein